MTRKTDFPNHIKWYLAYEVLFFEYADNKPQKEILVWENLVLIRASDPDEAFSKATEHGKLSEEELLINDKKGFCRFKGIRKLLPIYEDLADGVEIEWREFGLSPARLDNIIPPKEKLQAFQPLADFDN